jgi:heme exporter protein D
MGPHAAYIFAAYALTVATIAGLIAWLMIEGRGYERRIKDLEARGIKRRSADRS